MGGTLLIDEAYALARGGENDFGREAIDTVVKFMEDHRDDLAVIAAGYPEEMATLIDANPGLKSRFTRTISFPDYTTDELVQIFERTSKDTEYHLDESGRSALQTVIEAEPRTRGFGNAVSSATSSRKRSGARPSAWPRSRIRPNKSSRRSPRPTSPTRDLTAQPRRVSVV